MLVSKKHTNISFMCSCCNSKAARRKAKKGAKAAEKRAWRGEMNDQ